MLTKRDRSLSPVEELLLVSAARYDHVRSIIQPALKAGVWVVSDRFVNSAFAFQAYGCERLRGLFEAVTSIVVNGTFPNFTFILDLPEDEAIARRGRRGDADL